MGTNAADVKSIFGKAMDLQSPAERAAYLDEACGDNARLRDEVESLLKAGQEARGFFEALGDGILTGPTRTNVNDFRAILIDKGSHTNEP